MNTETPTQKRATADRPSLARGVRDYLLKLLESDEYGPGSPLPSERELIQLCGVSRPAVREAMQALEARGLVEIRHGGRAKVSEPTPDTVVGQLAETIRHLLVTSPASLDHLKDARLEFECGSAARAAKQANADDIVRLSAIIDQQASVHDDTEAFLAHDRAFHRALADSADNPIYGAVSEALFGWMQDFHADVVIQPGREALTIEEHRDIVRAVEAGSSAKASRAMRDHLTRANPLYHRTNKR